MCDFDLEVGPVRRQGLCRIQSLLVRVLPEVSDMAGVLKLQCFGLQSQHRQHELPVCDQEWQRSQPC